jgi:hypothetical protein
MTKEQQRDELHRTIWQNTNDISIVNVWGLNIKISLKACVKTL